MTDLLNYRYRILRALGSGGFGETFLAEDINMPTHRRCVVKKLRLVAEDLQTLGIIKDRFAREAAILEMLGGRHDQIPDLYAYFIENENFYLVQEWVEGQTLTEKFRQQGKFNQLQVQQILLELLPVLEFVHSQNIIHRDIKPDNIIIRKDGKPVLIDFGAVKEAVSTVVYKPGAVGSMVIGTPGFLPPEQAVGRPVFASDLYSLGMTAIYLLTGKSPQEIDTHPRTGEVQWEKYIAPADLNQTFVSIDARFAAILSKAVQPHPRDRYTSAAEMEADLRQLLGQQAAAPVQPGTPGTPGVIPPATIVSQPMLGTSPPPLGQPAGQPIYPSPGQRTPMPPPTQATMAVGSGRPYATPSDASSSPPTDSGGSWLKPALLGGAVGLLLLTGALAFRAFQPLREGPVASPSPSPTPTESAGIPDSTIKESPPTPSPSPSPSDSPSPSPSAKPTCGDPPDSGDVWYPVFIDNGDLKSIRVQYCEDAIAKTREDGTPSVQVASFTSLERAEAFAKEVGGTVGQPRNLPTPSPSESPTESSSPSPSPSESPSPSPGSSDAGTNATIIGESGEKNIRSGPGTSFPIVANIDPGDRVQILDSGKDQGGYLWYRVLVPTTKREGWLAAHLVKPD